MNCRIFVITTSVVTLFSLLSAWLTEVFVSQRIAIIGSFAGLQKSYNTGIAFGLSLGPFQDLLIVAALILVTGVALHTAKTRCESVGFGCIVGGGLANVIDRFLDGRVTDVFQVGSFPIFNVADVAINIGVGVLVLNMILVHKSETNKKRGED